jgi:hypothetical protein
VITLAVLMLTTAGAARSTAVAYDTGPVPERAAGDSPLRRISTGGGVSSCGQSQLRIKAVISPRAIA